MVKMGGLEQGWMPFARVAKRQETPMLRREEASDMGNTPGVV